MSAWVQAGWRAGKMPVSVALRGRESVYTRGTVATCSRARQPRSACVGCMDAGAAWGILLPFSHAITAWLLTR